MSNLRELPVPNELTPETHAHELIRFWVTNGRDHMSLRVGLFGKEREAQIWGHLIADLAAHAARAISQQEKSPERAPVYMAQIAQAFANRLTENPEITGKTQSQPVPAQDIAVSESSTTETTGQEAKSEASADDSAETPATKPKRTRKRTTKAKTTRSTRTRAAKAG